MGSLSDITSMGSLQYMFPLPVENAYTFYKHITPCYNLRSHSTSIYFFGMKSDQGHDTALYCDISNQKANGASQDSNCPLLG